MERSGFRSILLVRTSAVCLLLTTVYLLYLGHAFRVLDSSKPPIMNKVPLRIALSEASGNSILGSVTIHVVVTNESPSPVYLLRWSSPLDPRAVATGTVAFVHSKTNETAPCLNIKINHKMPESGYFSAEDEAIITIPPGGTAQRDLQAKEPDVALKKGEKYFVKAQGNWMGVWTRESGGEDARRLSSGNGLTGEFESNQIEVEIPKYEGDEL